MRNAQGHLDVNMSKCLFEPSYFMRFKNEPSLSSFVALIGKFQSVKNVAVLWDTEWKKL